MAQNVRVAVRVRPFNARERALGSASVVETAPPGGISVAAAGGGSEPRSFGFDHVFGVDSTQDELAAAIGDPMVATALDGFNATIFAYGQTGSGKSWSMSGSAEQPGLIPRMVGALFRRVAAAKAAAADAAATDAAAAAAAADAVAAADALAAADAAVADAAATAEAAAGAGATPAPTETSSTAAAAAGAGAAPAPTGTSSTAAVSAAAAPPSAAAPDAAPRPPRQPAPAAAPPPPPPPQQPHFLVTVSYLELYNEVVKDLLNPSDKQLAIRQHPQLGVYVQDLAELVVAGEGDVLRLLEQGARVRHVAATAMNERSSRSHSVFTLRLEQRSVVASAGGTTTTTVSSRINLVDLAGSERAAKTGATGDVLRQGASINKSLSALGNCISALAEGGAGKHVPYRDSKLTRLLQDSLGGNALTVMLCAVSPADDNADETLGTLAYAARAKAIKNHAVRNEDVHEALVRQLREEVEALRRALAAAQGGDAAGGGGGGGASSTTATGAAMMMEETLANLERAKAASWEERERLSAAFEAERARNLANEQRIRVVMAGLKEDHLQLLARLRALVKARDVAARAYKRAKRAAAHT